MRLALFALLLTLPLTACDPDADADSAVDTTEAEVEVVPVEPAPELMEEAPGDTGLPDTLDTTSDIDAAPAEVQDSDGLPTPE